MAKKNLTAMERLRLVSIVRTNTLGTWGDGRRLAIRKTAQQALLYLGDIVSKKNERFYTAPGTQPPNIPDSHRATSAAARSAGWQSGYKNIIPITAGNDTLHGQSGNPDTLISKLSGLGADIDKFFTFELTSAQLASLVPKIIIYKLDYEIVNGQIDREGVPKRRRIVFEKALSAEEMKQAQVLSSTGGNIGGSGIESFSWDLKGVNPAEVDSNIIARLNLYFNNVNVFQQALDEIWAASPAAASTGPPIPGGHATGGQLPHGSFIDLITFAPPSTSKADLPCLESYIPEFFEILVEVGWDMTSHGTQTLFDSATKDYIAQQTVSLYLTLTDHKFDFKEDGSATLEINYRARSTLNSNKYDLLNPPPDVSYAAAAVKDTKEEMEEAAEDEEVSKAATKNLALQEKELVEKLQANYSRIIDELLKNVYVAEIPNVLLGMQAFYDPNYNVVGDIVGITYTLQQLFKIIGSTQGDVATTHPTAPALSTPGAAGFQQQIIDPIVSAYKNAYSGVDIYRRWRDLDTAELTEWTLDPEKELQDADQARKSTTAMGEDITTDKGEKSKINFLYLGDILEVFLDTTAVAEMLNKSRFGVVLTDFRYKNYFKLLEQVTADMSTGEFHIAGISAANIKCEQANMNQLQRNSLFSTMNLANVPINLELFLDFFTEKVVANNRQNYYLEDFINDLFISFIRPILGSQGILGVSDNQPTMVNINIDTTNQCALFQDNNKIGVNQRKALMMTSAEYTLGEVGDYQKGNNYINPVAQYIASAGPVAKGPTPGAPATVPASAQTIVPPIFPPRSKDERDFATVKVLGINMTMDNLDGDYANNSSSGIKNFIIGLDRGILKAVSFERVDQPYLREARTAKAKNFGVGQLRELYNVNLTLYGNNLLKPGQIIYVEPNSLIFGRPTHEHSAARVLGMGGYYLVVDVSNEISEDGWETTVKALHMAMPAIKPKNP